MINKKALLAVAVLTSSTFTIADEESGGFYVSGGWNKFLYDSDRFIKDQNDGYLGFGYQYDLDTAVELMINRGNTTDRASLGNETDVLLTSLNLVKRFTPIGESGLFGRLGLGYGRMTPETDHIKKEAAAKLGLGYDYHVTENLALQAAMDVVYGIDSEMADFIPSAGITYFFGPSKAEEPTVVAALAPAVVEDKDSDGDGVLDKYDQCPNTPAGDKVDAKGCSLPKDSDNDGVVDAKDACPNTPAGAKVDARGCREALEKTVAIDLYVTFPHNSTDISAAYKQEIGKVAKFMTQYPDTKCQLAGHTDSTGSEKYNLALSKKRAAAVVSYLVNEFGIDASRLSSQGFGESQPIADNGSRAGQAKNRRVTATIKAITKK